METSIRSRRSFLALVPALLASLAATTRGPRTGGPHTPTLHSGHPDPRPGIDASHVVPRERLSDDVAPVFDMVREIPEIVDGIRCQCGCADLEGMYSLLSCYEGDGMAQYCMICKGEARMVHRLHAEGRTLDQIRAAIDARYG